MRIFNMRPNVFVPLIILFFIIGGCAATVDEKKETTITQEPVKEAKIEQPPAQKPENKIPSSTVPPVTWQPSFKVQEIELEKTPTGLPKLKVGANVETKGTQTIALSTIVKKLAALKGFNVSWNQDVYKEAPVDVDIKADDDFWVALDNILRQVDYFFEFKKDTLIIGYKQSKTYNLVIPNVSYTFTTAVGGNMIGGPTVTENLGEISLATVPPEEQKLGLGQAPEKTWAKEKGIRYVNRYDLWKNIRQNLDEILQIWETKRIQKTSVEKRNLQQPTQPTPEKTAEEAAKETLEGAELELYAKMGLGSYTIDESLGTIIVTASPSVQEKVKEYIDTVKKWLYKQISIEAHILEVQLSSETSRGIDWSKVLKAANRDTALISGSIGYGDQGNVYQVDYSTGKGVTREGLKLLGSIFLNDTSFELLVNALDEQGNVRTLSQPKINLMNGSPGLLTVGETVRYIREVKVDVDAETGVRTYTVETDDVLSGIAFSVMGNVLGEDQLVLYITPVTSDLKEPIEYRKIGEGEYSAGVEVGLPKVNLRQMATMARVKDGDILILGGLIDDLESKDTSGVPILGKIPLVKWAFSNESKIKSRRELIVILRPSIINI